MVEFITAEDINDAVLTGRAELGPAIKQANEYMNRKASSFGISTPYVTNAGKALGVAVACAETCLALVGTDPTVTVGGREEDVFERKYNLYKQKVLDLASDLTKADFMAPEDTDEEEEDSAWTKSISLHRA